MTGLFILDGYNLLRRGFAFGGRPLRDQRKLLEARLREFLRSHSPVQIVLVYDGTTLPPERDPSSAGGRREHAVDLEILYSRAPQTADDLVLEECRRRLRHGRVTVVTSDRRDIVRRLPAGVRHQSSEDFAHNLDEFFESGMPTDRGDSATEAGGEPEKPAELSPDEVDEWLRAFGAEDRGPRLDEESHDRE